jgi:S1-C subfamily serine protease
MLEIPLTLTLSRGTGRGDQRRKTYMLNPRAIALLIVLLAIPQVIGAQSTNAPTDFAQQLYDRVRPSLVAVQYTLDTELGRHELIVPGIVVNDDGLILFPMAAVDERFPNEQLTEFKVIVPKEGADPQELDAIFQGRDERSRVAFVKTKDPQKWSPIHFEKASPPVGDTVYSVGLLPKVAGYHAYLMRGMVSAYLLGETKQILATDGGLATVGSPVFSANGKAIGFVNYEIPYPLLLNDPKNPMAALANPPRIITPTAEFEQSLSDPPTADHPLELAWIGVPEMNGLKKEEAEYFGLGDQPAIQVGGVVPNTPAERSGLKQGNIIVKINGQPLERGDEPEELPLILRRKLLRLKPGDTVTFTVLPAKGAPLTDVKITLEQRPKNANLARRDWAEDLGFGVRELVFLDTYALKLKPDTKGLVVTIVKPDSSAATARLNREDLVLQLNGQPVTDLDSFKTTYQDFRKSHPREAVVMVVRREGREETIRIEPPQ